jgi:hypothetical protein
VSICPQCAGEATVIASIEEQAVIDKILNHLMKKALYRQSCCLLHGPHPIQTGLQSYGFHTSLNGTATER